MAFNDGKSQFALPSLLFLKVKRGKSNKRPSLKSYIHYFHEQFSCITDLCLVLSCLNFLLTLLLFALRRRE